MVYSSITPHVHLLKTAEHEHEHTMLNFAASAGPARRGHWGGGDFGVSAVVRAMSNADAALDLVIEVLGGSEGARGGREFGANHGLRYRGATEDPECLRTRRRW